jgi:hypothetical protein
VGAAALRQKEPCGYRRHTVLLGFAIASTM